MSFVIDALIILVCVFTVVVSAKRGFVKTLMSFFSTIVAIVCSYTFTPYFAEFLKNKLFLEPISSSIADTVRSVTPVTGGKYDIDLLFSDMPPTMSAILDRYKVDPAFLRESMSSLSEQGEDSIEMIADSIAMPVVDIISVSVAFISLFLIFTLLLYVFTVVINTIFKLPVLRSANTFLGVVFGVIIAIMLLFVYSSLVSSLVTSLGAISPEWFGEEVVEKTLIVKFFSEHSFLSIVNSLLS